MGWDGMVSRQGVDSFVVGKRNAEKERERDLSRSN